MFDEIKIQENEDIYMSQISKNCPVCNSILEPKGPVYSIEQLFDLWKPLIFSLKTIEEHRAKSPYTQLYNCPTCNLEIFLPQIIGSPQFYIEAYNLRLKKVDEPVFSYSDEKWEFKEAIKDLGESNSVLEIGCGNGAFLSKIRTLVPNYIGVEYNEEAIKNAREKGLNVCGLDEEMHLVKGSYDFVISFHVLEHVENPMEFIQKMCSFLKKDGRICISVPNQDGPIRYIDPCIQNMPPHHASRWHKKTFEKVAQKFDLKIEKIAYEPLLLINHDYYSYYWPNYFLTRNTLRTHYFKKGVKILLGSFFLLLKKMGLEYFPFLTGQSIYILMRKKN